MGLRACVVRRPLSETRPVVTFWNAFPSCSRSEGLQREECVGEEQEAAGAGRRCVSETRPIV